MTLVDRALYTLDLPWFASSFLGLNLDETQRTMLASRSRRGILNCSRQWGKSTITAVKAVHRAEFFPGSLVIVVCPSARQSGEFLRKAEPFVLALGHPLKGDGYNDLSLLFPNGSRLVGLPGKESTTRGFSAVSLMLIDEAAAVQDAMYHALTPMLAISRGDLWLMSTPRGKQGFFYDEWSRGGEAWHRIQATGPECSRIDPVFLEDERRSKGEARYRQEYLCEFVAPEGALFDEEAIRRLIVDEFEPLVLA